MLVRGRIRLAKEELAEEDLVEQELGLKRSWDGGGISIAPSTQLPNYPAQRTSYTNTTLSPQFSLFTIL